MSGNSGTSCSSASTYFAVKNLNNQR
nr:unnamed protein product [Callosobruchus chinensis]